VPPAMHTHKGICKGKPWSCAIPWRNTAIRTPVWARSSFTHQVNYQLNSSMCLITGCLRSTPVPWLPVLASIAPPGLRRQAATAVMLSRILRNSSWPLHDDFANHLPARLKSRRPIWSVDTTGVTDDLWRDAWASASVVNHGLVPETAVRPPGFDLPRQPLTLLNQFRTGHCVEFTFELNIKVQVFTCMLQCV